LLVPLSIFSWSPFGHVAISILVGMLVKRQRSFGWQKFLQATQPVRGLGLSPARFHGLAKVEKPVVGFGHECFLLAGLMSQWRGEQREGIVSRGRESERVERATI